MVEETHKQIPGSCGVCRTYHGGIVGKAFEKKFISEWGGGKYHQDNVKS
jgi:hypothetical protein